MAHFHKMDVTVFISGSDQFLFIVDLSYCGNGITAQMGLDQQGLGIAVRDTSDPHRACKLIQIAVELCAEGGIFNIVNGSGKASSFFIYSHAPSSGSKM